MIFPNKMKLSDRLSCWFIISVIGLILFLIVWPNSTPAYRYNQLPDFTFSGALFVWLFGSVFFTVDYTLRKATEAARWSAILIISGFFLFLWGAAEELTLLYLNWFSANPANAAGVTSLALGLLLFCGIVANWSFPFAVEFVNRYWIGRRKEAEA